MAIVTLGVTLNAIHPALTTSGSITLASGSPPRTSGHPTYLRFAHGAPQPVAAPLFHQNHLTRRTRQSLPLFHHIVQHLLRLLTFILRSNVITVHLFLIFFTILSLVNGLYIIKKNKTYFLYFDLIFDFNLPDTSDNYFSCKPDK